MDVVQAIGDFLDVVRAVMFVGLAVSATVIWFRRRGAPRAWLAATLGVLALITVLGLLVPEDPEPASGAAALTTVTVALLALFPYLLFRFAGTFRRRPLIVEAVALTAAVVVSAGAFAVGAIPGEGEAWSTIFTTWVVLLLVQWLGISGFVAVELWRAGRGQPTVSRRRMQMLSVASVGLALVLVLAATAGSGGGDAEVGDVVVALLTIAAAPMFLLGFAPPQAVLAAWRRPELDELRKAEEVLLQATSKAEVGARLLPHVTRIIGGQASVLFDDDDRVVGVDGMTHDEAVSFFGQHVDGAQVIVLPVRAGRLAVRVSRYTPYFARAEAELLGRLATFTDLALSRAELSERERQTAVELQAANEAMREFLAIASHDLRTPVTVIKGFASTLESGGDRIDPLQRQQFLATIRRHADHLGAIIDDLLTTSRLEADVLEPSPSVVRLRPFVERVVGDVAATLQADIDVPVGLAVRVDEEHLQRMLSNYLVNAGKYGAPPVIVRARPAGDVIEIVVCDQGRGVAPEFEARVFEKFARADKRNSRDNQGTGLGLAIVRGLARAAGGDAWYERNHPSGACFGVRLPAAPDAPAHGAGCGGNDR